MTQTLHGDACGPRATSLRSPEPEDGLGHPVTPAIANTSAIVADNWQRVRFLLIWRDGFFRGFSEAMAGLPFDYRAVDGEEALAIHYESGRYWAAHYRALGKRVTWKNQRHIPPTLKADLLRAMMP